LFLIRTGPKEFSHDGSFPEDVLLRHRKRHFYYYAVALVAMTFADGIRCSGFTDDDAKKGGESIHVRYN
jgi:hypothetical protein